MPAAGALRADNWQQFLHDHDDPPMVVDGIVGPRTWQSLISGMYAG